MNAHNLSLVVTLLIFAATGVRAAEVATHVPPPVPGFPIGRCVQVVGVTTPEEAKQVGFEYLELALPALLPLSDEEFEKQAARLRGIGLPMISGYGFLPSDIRIVGTNVDAAQVDKALRHGLARAKQ